MKISNFQTTLAYLKNFKESFWCVLMYINYVKLHFMSNIFMIIRNTLMLSKSCSKSSHNNCLLRKKETKRETKKENKPMPLKYILETTLINSLSILQRWNESYVLSITSLQYLFRVILCLPKHKKNLFLLLRQLWWDIDLNHHLQA